MYMQVQVHWMVGILLVVCLQLQCTCTTRAHQRVKQRVQGKGDLNSHNFQKRLQMKIV